MWTEPDLFPRLEPPAGGLVGLRERLERSRRRRRWAGLLVATTAATALLWLALPAPAPELPHDAGLAAFGLYEAGAPVAPGPSTAILRVPLSDPDTVFYRVASIHPQAEDQ